MFVHSVIKTNDKGNKVNVVNWLIYCNDIILKCLQLKYLSYISRSNTYAIYLNIIAGIRNNGNTF